MAIANIKDFLASFTDDLAKPSRFEVLVTATHPLLTSIMSAQELSLRCENAVIPGRTLETADLRIYGPTEKFPYKSSYEDITLTFICTDGSLVEKQFFNQWMQLVNPSDSWNFQYKSTYRATIQINQYDNADNIIHTVYLIDAFPLAVNQLDLDWSSSDTYHKLSVVFAYTYWTAELNSGSIANGLPTLGQMAYNFYAAQTPDYLLNNIGPNFTIPSFPATSSVGNAIPGSQGITVISPIGPNFNIIL